MFMNKTILVVEDEKRMRILLSDYLKKKGFKYLEASNGIEAIDIFNKEKLI